MSEVAFVNVSKSYGETPVLIDLSLHIPDGEFCVILGPSGCGKSTMLRLIAGLESAELGSIHIDGKDVTNTSPADRGVGMVFQNYALYPHMTVAENIGLPLKLRKSDRAAIKQRVSEVASMLSLSDLLERRPRQLSGGQRQRVALGRAIAQKPNVYLLDEPLSNVDALLRLKMRTELQTLWKTLGTTVVYVTHDQSEALSLGTLVCILNDGRMQQIGSSRDIYDRPKNLFVAGFVGSPPINLIEGKLRFNNNLIFDPWSMPLPLDLSVRLQGMKDKTVVMGVRPEKITALPERGATFMLSGSIERVEYQGSDTWLSCRVEGNLLVARAGHPDMSVVGRPCHLDIDRDALHWFDKETEERL